MPEFINEFTIANQVKELQLFTIGFDSKLAAQKRFGYKVASQTARKLTFELNTPVASMGEMLVALPELNLPKIVTMIMKIEGTPTEVEVSINRNRQIGQKDGVFCIAAQKYLNRYIDLALTPDYLQDGRGFYEKRTKDVSKYYACQQGIYINTQVHDDGTQTVIIDPLTQIRSKLNLLEALKLTLKDKGIDNWKNAKESEKEINQIFRNKSYSLRSTYVEPKGEDLERNSYRFVGFNFQKVLENDNDPKSPVNFHKSFGRKFSMDQPVIEVIAHGGFRVTQIPELLEENPSLHMLKRFGVSEKFQARSLMDTATRFYTTYTLMRPLVDKGIIKQEPMVVETKDFSPVRLTVENDYIQLKKNYDFQKYFQKNKVLKKPNLKKIHLFSTKKDSQQAEKLTKSLQQAFVDFGIHVPEVNRNFDCPETLDEFRAYLLQVASDGKFSKEDLMLVVFSFGGEDLEDATYNALKRASFRNLFPLQFVDIDSIEDDAEEKDLRKDIVNPLMLQIVAKGGGQPYGLQPGFAPAGTLFVAIDRHRNPFKANSPLVTSVVLFDSNGSYACSKSVINQMDNEVNLSDLLKECFDKLSSVTHQERWNLVVYMEDTGIGTIEEQLSKDAHECCFAAKKIGAKYVFITANKSSHHRLYSGDPSDRLSASRVPSFTAALKMNNPYNILVVSTEPIITKTAKEIGTPRPVLYTIFSLSAGLDLDETKEDVAKSIIWLCRHSWVSPTSTRLPAPLYFGNKLSKLVSETETPVSPNDMEAPLFL